MKNALPVLLLTALLGCGGGPPTQPTPPPTPPPPPKWTLSGRVVSNPGNQPISGVDMAFEPAGGMTVAARSDTAGTFSITGDGSLVPGHKVILSAEGFLERETYLTGGSSRESVVIDLIELRPPFSLDYYRQIARGLTAMSGQPGPLAYITEPSFYIRTTTQEGQDIAPRDVDMIAHVLRNNTPALTGSRFQANVIEFGAESRPFLPGWVNVEATGGELDNACGRGGLRVPGGSPRNPYAGVITLRLGASGCRCQTEFAIAPGVVAHELGHAFGLGHHTASNGIMRSIAFCEGNFPSRDVAFIGDEKFHSEIRYTRPIGNADPDKDPGPLSAPFSVPALEPRIFTCFRR
jgi:hypothetical protein